MDLASYQLLLVDTAASALLIVDGNSGELLTRLSYPDLCTPRALAVTSDLTKAFLVASTAAGNGALFVANLHNFSFYQLPLELPQPVQFTLAPDGQTAYLADPSGSLYAIDIVSMRILRLGQTENAACVGLAADNQAIYSAWEQENNGNIAIFSPQGQLLREHSFAGIPTNITLSGSRILIPFTAAPLTGEGLIILDQNAEPDSPPAVITIHCPLAKNGLNVYPCSVTVGAGTDTAYVVNEDSSSITVIDLNSPAICDHISVGRSISNLYLLPDPRFAIATSNMFADLALIDLVNKQLLSITASSGEFLNQLTVLPA